MLNHSGGKEPQMQTERALALLRAINVNGRNMIRMKDLQEVCSRLEWRNVTTVGQTGNVVFQPTGGLKNAETDLEQAVAQYFGLQISVMIRTAGEITKVVNETPFISKETGQLAVIFLKGLPNQEKVHRMSPLRTDDCWELAGRELYVAYTKNLHSSPYSVAYFERHLGIPGTLRNWRTILRIEELMRKTSP